MSIPIVKETKILAQEREVITVAEKYGVVTIGIDYSDKWGNGSYSTLSFKEDSKQALIDALREECQNCKERFDPEDMEGSFCFKCDEIRLDAITEARTLEVA